AATASDPEGQGLTYTWTQVSGPAVTLSGASTATPSFTAPEGLTNTAIVLQCTVSDGTNTTVDTVTVNVNRDNDAPSVDAGATQTVDEGDVVTLAATASDPEGQGLAYAWTQVSGPAVTLSGASTATPSFTAPEGLANTAIVLQCTVSDGTNTTVDTVTVTVNADNDAPAVDAGSNQTVDEGDVVTLAATASDPESQGLTYAWTQVSGPAVTLSNASTATPSFTAPEGLATTAIVLQCSVSDGTDTAIDTVTITVNAHDDAPSVDAGSDRSARHGEVVSLAATASDPEDRPLSYTWIQRSGPPVSLLNANTATPSFVAPNLANDAVLVFEVAVSDGTTTVIDTVSVAVAAVELTFQPSAAHESSPVAIAPQTPADELDSANAPSITPAAAAATNPSTDFDAAPAHAPASPATTLENAMNVQPAAELAAPDLVIATVSPTEVTAPPAAPATNAGLHAAMFDGDFFAAFHESAAEVAADLEAVQRDVDAAATAAPQDPPSAATPQAMMAAMWSVARAVQPVDQSDARPGSSDRRRDDERRDGDRA
ncbi:MAG: hypothetical protein WCK33_09465, partial [Phycisphaerae bacterium]